MSYTPKFPINPSDNAEVLDRYGNKWQYDATSNAWISKGVIKSYTTVSELEPGLVTPEIYNKLQNLRTYSKMYNLKNTLKINPGSDAYWYYFRSSDKLIRFRPESDNILRIEVDRGRLFQVLLKNQRVGPPGSVGDIGDPGPDGLPGLTLCETAAGEPEYEPSILNGDRLDFAIYTPVPLVRDGIIDLPNDHVPSIAVRLHKITSMTGSVVSDQLSTLGKSYNDVLGAQNYANTRNLVVNAIMTAQGASVCGIPMSRVYKISPKTIMNPAVTIDIDPENGAIVGFTATNQAEIDRERTLPTIRFDKETNIVCGSIFLVRGKWEKDNWTVRSRQRGPDGPPGSDGSTTLIIETSSIDNSNMEASCPIVNVRYDASRETLYTFCSTLSSDVCVSRVGVLSGMSTLTNGPILGSKFAAVQMILDECKYINVYTPEIQPYEIPLLSFDSWEPQSGCVTQRHFDRHKFDWISSIKGAACSPYGVYNNLSKTTFPYKIITAATPPEDECCQEDWFYCPNIQDGPCEDEPPPPPPPPSSPTPLAASRATFINDATLAGSKVSQTINIGTKKWNIKS